MFVPDQMTIPFNKLHLQCSTSNEECSNQAPNKLDSLIKEQNIVIPQPDPDQINKIQNSCPKVKLFSQTSHELLSDISSNDINNSAQRWDLLVLSVDS